MTEEEVLHTLDNYRNGYDPSFVQLGHPYIYPIDSRINVFSNRSDNWAVAIEVLGFATRADSVRLEISYFGNCLIDLDEKGGYLSNSYCVYPIDQDSFDNTVDTERLRPDAQYWIVRDEKVDLIHSKEAYRKAGIGMRGFETEDIAVEGAARLLVTRHRDLFRASDEELRKSIPDELEKVLVINEWHHKDFYQKKSPFEDPETLTRFDLNNPEVTEMIRQELRNTQLLNSLEWDNNRPGSYETWQHIAKVIVTGDPSFYNPSLVPNSYWRNWPDAGTM